jgi:hypothetical protein
VWEEEKESPPDGREKGKRGRVEKKGSEKKRRRRASRRKRVAAGEGGEREGQSGT